MPAVTAPEVAAAQLMELPEVLKTQVVKGRTYIVTGANTGLGFESAKQLVKLDAARVILAVRTVQKGEAAKTAIEAATGKKNVVQVWQLDLSSYESVKAFAVKVETELERVDGLVNNGGIAYGEWVEHEGLEGDITVNVISQILLTILLLPFISKSKAPGAAPRIVFVGSVGTFVAPKPLLDGIKRDDILADLSNKAKWGKTEMNIRYITTKLLLHYAVRELASLAPFSKTGVIINITDPGLCKTGLIKKMSVKVRFGVWFSQLLFGRSPAMGSRGVLAGLALGEPSHGAFIFCGEVGE